MHAHKWLNTADFSKALEMARTRFPQPPGKAVPAAVRAASPAKAVAVKEPSRESPAPAPVPRPFALGPVPCRAKFLGTLRVRVNLQR
jgi:hypothetical protein